MWDGFDKLVWEDVQSSGKASAHLLDAVFGFCESDQELKSNHGE